MAQTQGGPGERRLDRPPSERYRPSPDLAAGVGAGPRGSVARAMLFGLLAAAGGAVGFVALAKLVLVTAGLIVWAGIAGWVTALAVRYGAQQALERRGRLGLAVGLALVSVGLGQLGIWVFGLAEGGALGLVDYLATVFGFLVPIQFVVAGALAWYTGR